MLALVHADLVDRHDPRMLQFGRGLRFRMKPLDVRLTSQLPR